MVGCLSIYILADPMLVSDLADANLYCVTVFYVWAQITFSCRHVNHLLAVDNFFSWYHAILGCLQVLTYDRPMFHNAYSLQHALTRALACSRLQIQQHQLDYAYAL